MIIIDGYTITQYTTKNKIIITLPQTLRTITNTVTQVSNRRNKLTDAEEAALLIAVKAMFENGRDEVKE